MLVTMRHSEPVREFLRSRRARITPDRVDLAPGTNRRVPGLRREEVALLAGIGVDYYARLERGALAGVSDEVLRAVADALLMDEAETAYLFDLARGARSVPVRRRRPHATREVRPSLQRFMDAAAVPVWIRDERMNVMAANRLGRALFSPLFDGASHPVNNARFVFLDPRSRDFYAEWERGADQIVATLRSSAARRPRDQVLADLIRDLIGRSPEFAGRWGQHDVRFHRNGVKHLHHPVVGELELAYDAMGLPADPGWTMFAFSADLDSPTAERLRLLADWGATTAERADGASP